ncbi:dihydrolipoyl dehydrogenase [Nitrospira sp. Kam-Ns4a]
MSPARRIAILGAGPGGYVAAIRAAQLGARVTVVEEQALGGVCLNWGCIPSKALLSVVDLGDRLKAAGDLGLRVAGPLGFDLAAMVARKNRVVAGLVKGIGTLFKAWGIEHLDGRGELLDERRLRVVARDGTETRIEADAVILATGSSWPNLPRVPVDGRSIITSKEALDLTAVPARLLIVGAGVEGCEFASLFSGLGARVTMVELMPRILPQEDEEIATFMERELKKRGVDIRTGTTVERVARDGSAVTATLAGGDSLTVETVLVSVGRGFHSKGIGLEKAGVQVGPRGEIQVNERMETNVPGVYAIGDVVGQAMLAHVASAQGKVAAENATGGQRRIRYDVIPAGIFTLPEIGRVGLTEQQAREQGRASDVTVGRFRYTALGKAQATGETTGMFKLIADGKTGRLLGAHIVGAHAADLIHEAALALQLGATAGQVAELIHAHPTLSEGLLEAAEDVEGLAIHLARKKP